LLLKVKAWQEAVQAAIRATRLGEDRANAFYHLSSLYAQLNNQGQGRFQDFREAHTSTSSPQAHFRPGFLPWHRAFILDLEREDDHEDRRRQLERADAEPPVPTDQQGDTGGERDHGGDC